MNLRLFLLPSVLLLVAPLTAQTTTLDFNYYPGPDGILGTADDVPIVGPTTFAAQTVQLTDQFAALGIDFTPNPGTNDKNEILNSSSFTTPPGHTPPNLLGSAGAATITGSFSHPVYTVSALIGISGGSDEMEIYDAAGASLGSMVGDDVVVTLTSVTPIASFEIRPIASTTPAIDNLEFDAATTGPALSVAAGAPGGSMTFAFAGYTPAGLIAVVYGPAGSYSVPSGSCAGLGLGLNPLNFPPVAALITLSADAAGAASLTQNVPAAGAGLSVQAVDAASCTASNVIVL